MGIEEFFPVWGELGELERRALAEAAARRSAGAGAMIHGGGAECTGLLLVLSGQLRAFITSEEGREITIYRLFSGDICLLSASCVISSMQFELAVQAEKPTEFMLIPPDAYKRAVNSSAPLANYTSRVMAERLSDVMWLMEQVMWKSMDRRLAAFLLEEAALEGSDELKLTHERIANHLGSAREVITRLLRYFQSEGLVKLGRGAVVLTDRERLYALSE